MRTSIGWGGRPLQGRRRGSAAAAAASIQHLFPRPRRVYIPVMMRPVSVQSIFAVGAAAALFAAATGLAFAGWIGNGARIFLSLAESGLSWCF